MLYTCVSVWRVARTIVVARGVLWLIALQCDVVCASQLKSATVRIIFECLLNYSSVKYLVNLLTLSGFFCGTFRVFPLVHVCGDGAIGERTLAHLHMYDSPAAERALLSPPQRSEPDPEDHPVLVHSLSKVRWDNPVVSSTCVLPPHESADRKALFFSRDEEMSNRAFVVLEASLVRCVGALILWAVACYALALSARCLMYGMCPVLTPPPSFPE